MLDKMLCHYGLQRGTGKAVCVHIDVQISFLYLILIMLTGLIFLCSEDNIMGILNFLSNAAKRKRMRAVVNKG